jgi:PAS domain S-box-containing protein
MISSSFHIVDWRTDLIQKEGLPALSAGYCVLWEWRIDEQAFWLSSNWSAVLGCDEPEAENPLMAVRSAIHPEDRHTVKEHIQLLTQKRTASICLAFRIHGPGDHFHWIYCRGNSVAGPPDSPFRMAGIFLDLSSNHVLQEKLTEDHQMLVRLVDDLPGMAYRMTPFEDTWTIEYISQGVFHLLGYDREYFMENIDAIYTELTDPDDYIRLWGDIRRAVAEKRSYQIFYRMRTADGVLKWVWEQGKPLFSENGRLEALEGFIADITRQKELEIKLHEENLRLKALIKEKSHFGAIIGKCPAMQQVYELIEKAATSSANVNIFGESGTGKELVARKIHELSDRAHKAFVPINCGALPESLLESEFFGYKKGAFTGATADQKGYLAAADGGTLFLDELGSMPLSLQVKLLRVLDGGGYSPLGSQEIFKPDIRIIAASNTKLLEMLKRENIRADFYYRINVLPINLPPLRERTGDIPLLIRHFLKKYDPEHRTPGMAEELCKTLCVSLEGYDWPGNVRELENVIQRYVTLGKVDFPGQETPAEGRVLALKHQELLGRLEQDGLRSEVDRYERDLLLKALEANRWKKEPTAAMLKLTTRTLYRKVKSHGLG